jgi:hypothetical protein
MPGDTIGVCQIDTASGRRGGRNTPANAFLMQGNILRFTVTTGEQVQMSFDGRVKGQAMRGSMEAQGGAMPGRYDWASQRETASAGSAAQH